MLCGGDARGQGRLQDVEARAVPIDVVLLVQFEGVGEVPRQVAAIHRELVEDALRMCPKSLLSMGGASEVQDLFVGGAILLAQLQEQICCEART